MNEYQRKRNCNLTQIGGLLDTKGYGIGMPLGSPFRDEITLAILQLQENNRLEILKRKWWEGGKCPKEEDHRAKVFVAVMEFVWTTRRSAESEEISMCQEMLSELRHAVSCKKTSRSRRRRRPGRVGVSVSKQLRAGRELRLSNGKLYSGASGVEPGLGPGPQRLLDDVAPLRGCTHIRICQECRRIQGMRTTRIPRIAVQADEQPPISGPQADGEAQE
ncbi:glutamate receptor ionotropic, kainate 5-like isoform X4 [Mustelus asterias]